MPRYKSGDSVIWSGEPDPKVTYSVVEWQPNNGPGGAYWLRNEAGEDAVASEDELRFKSEDVARRPRTKKRRFSMMEFEASDQIQFQTYNQLQWYYYLRLLRVGVSVFIYDNRVEFRALNGLFVVYNSESYTPTVIGSNNFVLNTSDSPADWAECSTAIFASGGGQLVFVDNMRARYIESGFVFHGCDGYEKQSPHILSLSSMTFERYEDEGTIYLECTGHEGHPTEAALFHQELNVG